MEDLSFWVKTVDVTAVAGEDFEERNQLVSMKAHETEREIMIKIFEDTKVESAETFDVIICDENTKK